MAVVSVVMVAAMSAGACATGHAVPRPFPGAALPPSAAVPPSAALPSEATERAPDRAEAPPEVPALSSELPALISTALSFRGIPYRNGGSDPSGFDCSGFVQYVYAVHGTGLPRDVRNQYRIGREIDRKDVKAGDLVFFETVSRGASHVGLAIGRDEFVHAPSSRGVVRVEHLSSSYWASRFVGARRVGDPHSRSTK